MKIHEIGGEFALIDRLRRLAPTSHDDLMTGIGDDAAVIGGNASGQDFLLATTDMLVDTRHFRRDWSTPSQIGTKAVTCNVSDIAAMGGTPTFMFVSIALEKDTEVSWAQELYTGMAEACRQYGIVLAGGDTTSSETNTICITLLGRATASSLCLRSHARPGDLLCVTGPLGGSAAGLKLLTMGVTPPDNIRAKHVTPGCRLDVSSTIAPLAGAMIDISDGLAAEVNHICDRSGTGATIVADQIPLYPSVLDTAALAENDPLAFALSGGEDFELLFSIDPENLKKLAKKRVDATIVGKVTEKEFGRVLILPDGKRTRLSGGYTHFQ